MAFHVIKKAEKEEGWWRVSFFALIEYKNKDEAKKQTVYRGQENPGIVHIAYVVDDVDRMFQEIKALGYEFYSAPMVTRENGPKITFFKGPDNVIIELYEKASQ